MKFLEGIILIFVLAAVAMAFPGPKTRAGAQRDRGGLGYKGCGSYRGGMKIADGAGVTFRFFCFNILKFYLI